MRNPAKRDGIKQYGYDAEPIEAMAKDRTEKLFGYIDLLVWRVECTNCKLDQINRGQNYNKYSLPRNAYWITDEADGQKVDWTDYENYKEFLKPMVDAGQIEQDDYDDGDEQAVTRRVLNDTPKLIHTIWMAAPRKEYGEGADGAGRYRQVAPSQQFTGDDGMPPLIEEKQDTP